MRWGPRNCLARESWQICHKHQCSIDYKMVYTINHNNNNTIKTTYYKQNTKKNITTKHQQQQQQQNPNNLLLIKTNNIWHNKLIISTHLISLIRKNYIILSSFVLNNFHQSIYKYTSSYLIYFIGVISRNHNCLK